MRYKASFPRLSGPRSKPDGCLKKLQTNEEPSRRSPRLILLRENSMRAQKLKEKATQKLKDKATNEEIAERMLCDYNKKHGTKLEFVGILAGKDNFFRGFGYNSNFEYVHGKWKHYNFKARRVDADPSDKPLVLFAELMRAGAEFHLITMSIVKPTDESNGCVRCSTRISHPRHGFRAGLYREPKILSKSEILSAQAASKLSEFALHSYNKKHGTTIKFQRALKCNSFSCSGLSMDFNEKKTNWVHMNFEVTVGRYESVVCLFAELYLEDNGEYVLATLSPAALAADVGEWKKNYEGVNGCVFCPADVLHPWHAHRHAFNHCP